MEEPSKRITQDMNSDHAQHQTLTEVPLKGDTGTPRNTDFTHASMIQIRRYQSKEDANSEHLTTNIPSLR